MIRKKLINWATESIRLEYGLFDPDRMPFCREPIEAIDGARGQRFLMRASVQSVKTLVLQIVALGTMLLRPRRALWFTETVPAVNDFVDEKFNPLFDSIPAVSRLLYHDRDKRSRHKFIYREGSLLCRSANIQLNRNSKSAQDLYLDEPWTYEPGQLTEIFDRALDYQDRSRIIGATSGPDAGGEVDRWSEMSRRRYWHLRCPHCRGLFYPEWGTASSEHGMRWETSERTRNEDLTWKYQLVRETVVYIPACCHTPIKYTQALQRAMNSGRPPTVDDPAGMAPGEYQTVNDDYDPNYTEWHWNALCHRPWPDLVVTWLEANQAKRRGSLELVENFKRKQLALPYSETLERAPRVEKWVETGYRLREPWADEAYNDRGIPYRSMTIDVQKDHLWVSIRKFARDGRSRLHWCERVLTFGNAVALGREENVSPRQSFADSGWNPDAVLRYCANAGFFALNGVSTKRGFNHVDDGIYKIYSEIETEDAFKGTVADRKIVGKFRYDTRAARNRLEVYRTLTTPDDKPLWTVADDTPAWYKEQVNANVQVAKRHPRSGAWYYDYVQTGPDHANDLECMHVVYASMAGFLGSESMEQPEGDDHEQ